MSAPAPVRVLIADAHVVVREGVAALLTPDAGFCLVGAACNGEEAVTLFREHRPDVLVMEARMPVLDGLGAAKILRKEFPQCALVLLSADDTREAVYQAVQLGVKSYLLKDTPTMEILAVLHRVAAGETYFPPAVGALLSQRLSQPELTSRESEILAGMATGKSNLEIGNTFFIAEGTVKAHVVNILKKMHVSDRTQAVTEGIRRGLIKLT